MQFNSNNRFIAVSALATALVATFAQAQTPPSAPA